MGSLLRHGPRGSSRHSRSCQPADDPLLLLLVGSSTSSCLERSCKTEALKSRFKLSVNNGVLKKIHPQVLPFPKAEEEELLRAEMETEVIVLSMAGDDSLLGFTSTEGRMVALGLCGSEVGPGTNWRDLLAALARHSPVLAHLPCVLPDAPHHCCAPTVLSSSSFGPHGLTWEGKQLGFKARKK